MEKRELVDAELTRYYYYLDERNKLIEQISDIQYEMNGCKGVGFSDEPKGASEDRQSKLIRLTEKKDKLIQLKRSYEVQCMNIENELHLLTLDADEIELLNQVKHLKRKYDDVAIAIGYANKVVVHRKYTSLLDRLSRMIV